MPLFSATHPLRASALIMLRQLPAQDEELRRTIRLGPPNKNTEPGSSRDATRMGRTVRPQRQRARRAWPRTSDSRSGGRGCLEYGAQVPAAAAVLVAMNAEIDIRDILPANPRPDIAAPHSVRDAAINIGASRYMADRIPGARLVELPGRGTTLVWLSDADAILGRDRGVSDRGASEWGARPDTRDCALHRHRRRN